jgi:hypothetical protein
MDERSITLRAADPTFDEGLAFARYLDEGGVWRFLPSRRHLAIIYAVKTPLRAI